MDVYQAVIKRRSIRKFQDKAVPYEALEKCADAARLAPSARNRQLCEYVIVDDESLLPGVFRGITTWLGQERKAGDPLPDNPPQAYIIILINNTLEAELGSRRTTTLYDVGLAAANIILVAQEQGIGTCPVLSFDEKALGQLLNIPSKYAVALVLAMGYPAEAPVREETDGPIQYWIDAKGVRHVPKRRLADITHRNRLP